MIFHSGPLLERLRRFYPAKFEAKIVREQKIQRRKVDIGRCIYFPAQSVDRRVMCLIWPD